MINLYLFNRSFKPTQVIIILWACWTHGDFLKDRVPHVMWRILSIYIHVYINSPSLCVYSHLHISSLRSFTGFLRHHQHDPWSTWSVTTWWPLMVLCWYQWQFQWQLDDPWWSSIGINDNWINNLPFCHWWQHSFNNLCTPFHHASLVPPFGINGKGYLISTASFIFNFLLFSSESLSSISLSIIFSCHHALLSSCSSVIMLFLLPLSWCFF